MWLEKVQNKRANIEKQSKESTEKHAIIYILEQSSISGVFSSFKVIPLRASNKVWRQYCAADICSSYRVFNNSIIQGNPIISIIPRAYNSKKVWLLFCLENFK